MTRIGSLIAAVVIASPALAQPCYRVLAEEEFCPDCPGVAVCLCFYATHGCPSAEVICYTRQKVIIEGQEATKQTPAPCYYTRPCASKFGGECHPVVNPCRFTGMGIELGTMMRHEQEVYFCIPI